MVASFIFCLFSDLLSLERNTFEIFKFIFIKQVRIKHILLKLIIYTFFIISHSEKIKNKYKLNEDVRGEILSFI